MKSPDRLKVTFGSIPDDEQDLALLNSIKFVKRPTFNLLWSPSTPPRNSRFKEAIEAQKKLLDECKKEVTSENTTAIAPSADLANSKPVNGTHQHSASSKQSSTGSNDSLKKVSPGPVQNGTLKNTEPENPPLEDPITKPTSVGEDTKASETVEPPKPAPAKTWASILGNPAGSKKVFRPIQPEPTVIVAPPKNFTAKAKNISELFRDIHISMKSPLVEPRGITNNNLLCYAHSILQSLIHVPPFLNLIKLLASSSISNPEKTPILNSLIEICKQFRTSSSKKPKNNREQEPIEPKLIIKLVQSLRPSFSTQIGIQEDAHEFFSALINGLSDETLALMKEELITVTSNFDSSKSPSIHIFQTEQPSTDSDEAEWVGVGANNKHFITRETKVITTPITSLFSGLYRHTMKVKGKAPSVSQDCSIDLQLEVEPDHIGTVQDALNHLLKAESLDKADPSDDFSAGHASKHFSFETLPPILVLHLKIVVFCKVIERARKILKDISCPPTLAFPAPKKFGNNAEGVIKYQLVAVVYHHGPEAMAGHYTCDVRRGDDSWIFCNDSEIETLDYKSIGTTEHTLDGTPYLLFYTRS